MRFRLHFLALLAFVGLHHGKLMAAPHVESPLAESVPVAGADPLSIPKVAPSFPVAKTLLFPVSAWDDSGELLTVTAKSSDARVMVRVKTGNPLMRFDIQHTGDGTPADPSYSGTMVFQLFRDIAPVTAGFISGFAQGGFYDDAATEHGRLFRIADLNSGAGATANIFQGGSPTGFGRGSVGFSFENEFHPSEIFSGRGQLAMANSGYDSDSTVSTEGGTIEFLESTKRGSNGSQFFITESPTRFLDFKHTVFGQLTHGFEMLGKLAATAKHTTDGTVPANDPDADEDPDFQRADQPLRPIKIVSAAVGPQFTANARTYTDAVLLLSATAPITATITVTATNAAGESNSQTFTATALSDVNGINSRPYLTPLPDATIAKGKQINLPFSVVDLERDYPLLDQGLRRNFLTADTNKTNPRGYSGILQSRYLGVVGNPSFKSTLTGTTTAAYEGPLYPALNVTQLDMEYRGTIDGGERPVDNYSASKVGVGDLFVTPEAANFYATVNPATPPVVAVARFRDSDPRGKAADISASINWGDGAAETAGTIVADTLKPSATGFEIRGAHAYKRAGTYKVRTTLSSAKGLRTIVTSTAVVTANALRGTGESTTVLGPLIANRVLATFEDSQAPGPATAYTGTIDWGDGTVGPGTVRAAGPGKFQVLGRHTYRDAETFSTSVRVHKAGTALTNDAVIWGAMTMYGFVGQKHLPPFNQAHLVADIFPVPVDHRVPNGATKPTKVTVPTGTTSAPSSQTYLTYSLRIINAGNLPSKPGMMRFYLSLDKKINLAAETVNGVTNPADIPLKMNSLGRSEFFLPAVPAGQSLQYYFEQSIYADYRLVPPKNETATGYNVLIQLDYKDPIADYQPIQRNAIEGSINGIYLSKSVLNTRESGTSDSFTVKLDKAPTQNVVIPIAIEDTASVTGTNEGELSVPGDPMQTDHTMVNLTFTSGNWSVPQEVKVTGKSDSGASGAGLDSTKTYRVLLNPAVSDDPFYAKMDGPDVTVSNGDRDGNVSVSTTSIVTSESASSSQHTATVTITLKREPTEPVTLELKIEKPGEGEITLPGGPDPSDPSKYLITFDKRDPSKTPPIVLSKSFTVTGKADGVADGDQTYKITFEPVASNDLEFKGLRPADITVKNLDVNGAP